MNTPNGPTPAMTQGQQVWVDAAYQALRPLFPLSIQGRLPAKILISYGRATRTAHGGRSLITALAGNYSAIFIDPSRWGAPGDVLVTLAHEMCHIAASSNRHTVRFSQAARRIGLEGKNFDRPDANLAAAIQTIIPALPLFPAAPINGRDRKQKTRLRRYHCGCRPPQKIYAGSDKIMAVCLLCQLPFTKVDW